MLCTEKELIKATDSLYQVDEETFKELFSDQRVKSIGGQKEYQDYYRSSKPIYPAIHTLEVVLRNKIDKTLSKYHPYWIMDLCFFNAKKLKDKTLEKTILNTQKNIEKIIESISTTETTISSFWNKCQDKENVHSILVSRLNLGFWIVILQNNRLFNNVYNKKLDFAKEIFPKLTNKIKKKHKIFYDFLSKKSDFSNRLRGMSPSEKTIFLVSLLSSIRNRLNHCEILFRNNGNSSITAKQYGIKIYLECRKNKIFEFLITILEEFSADSLKK